MRYVVTRSFQFRGTARAGSVIDLSEADLANPFVARHVEPLDPFAKNHTPNPPTYFGNGVPKSAPRETPAAVAAASSADLSVGQIRAKLAKLGVHYSNRMSAAELTALYRQAQEAVAGSPAAPNRPTA